MERIKPPAKGRGENEASYLVTWCGWVTLCCACLTSEALAAPATEPAADSRPPALPARLGMELGGHSGNTAPARTPSEPELSIATVNGLSIPSSEFYRLLTEAYGQPLVEAHGLELLLDSVQRDLSRQFADKARPPILVTADDVRAERERILGILYEELDARFQEQIDKARNANSPADVKKLQDELEVEHQQLLKQFFEQKHLTPTRLNILLETNACLRKNAEPGLNGKITEDMLRAEFSARFGEKVRIREIRLKAPQDYEEIKRGLAAGERFEVLARNWSIAPASVMPPFGRDDPLPAALKDAAFAMKVGEVSDLLNVDGGFYVLKLEWRIPQRGAFEQQRDILYRDVYERMLDKAVSDLRQKIAPIIRESLKIDDPIMAKQLQERIDNLNDAAAKQKSAEHSATQPTP